MMAVVLVVVAPAPQVAAQTGNPVVTIAGVPGPSGFEIETGTAVFDGFGECGGATPAAPPIPYPGNDCGAGDNVVRTADIVSYGTSVAVSNMLGPADDGGPEHVDDVFFVQTITPTSPDAVIEFVGLPAACRTGTNMDTGLPYDPQSVINSLPGGAYEILCNLGRLTGPTKTVFMRTQVRVSGDSKNEASFTSSNEICPDGFSTNGCSVITERPEVTGVDTNDLSDDETTFISARPQFDLAKNKYGPNYIGPQKKPNDTATTDDDEPGLLYRYYMTIEADATSDGKGGQTLDTDPITFDDMMYVQGTTTQIPNFELGSWYNGGALTPCFWNNHGGRPIPWGQQNGTNRNSTNSVVDTGTWGCAQTAPGDPIQVSLTGTDTSGSTYPDTGNNNATQLTPPYYVAAGYVYVWVPYEDIDRYDPAATCDAADAAAGYSAPFCGEVNGVGDLPVTNCVGNFDPDATDANGDPVSNYGPDIEPGTYGSGGGNNCRNTSMRLSNSGSFSKYYTTRVLNNGTGLGGIPPGQTYYHTGDGPLEPNQYIATWARMNNTGTIPQTGVVVCEKVDNMTNSLAPIQTAGAWVPTNPAGLTNPGWARTVLDYPNDQSTVVIEYATGPAGTPTNGYVQWGNDHLAGGLNPLSGLYNSATFGTQQTTGCADADGNWNTDPYAFDANPTESLSRIRSVRARTIDGYELIGGDRLVLKLQLQARNNFFGGPHDGTLIPAGVIAPNFATWKVNELRDGEFYLPTNYNSNSDSGSYGDRMIFSRGFVRLEKWLVPYNTNHAAVDPADYQATDGGLAGDPFQFRLLPAAISNLSPATAPMTNVQVTDVLPSWLTYDPVCTQAVSAYGPPVITPNTPNPGETTLTWNLGTVMPNTQIDPIDFCVDSSNLAPDGTNAVNTAVISSDEDTSTEAQRSGSATVQLAQLGEFRMAKSVDTNLDPEDNPQNYTVEWLNSSDFVTLDAPVVIDVFSHNLDGTSEGSGAPRNPESDFSGTIVLTGPGASTMTGEFYYSKRDEYDIDQDPADATNPFLAAPYDGTNPNLGPIADADGDGESDSGHTVWCLAADFGTGSCPASYAEATALMFVGEDEIGPGDSGSLTFTIDAFGNDSGDVYGNRAAGFTPSLPGQISQTNTVQVEVVALSLGDFVWFDYDNDGTYDPTQGEIPVPDGVTVELRDATGTVIATTTTVAGRYVFLDLVAGTYSVSIPLTEFAAGGPLEDFYPSTPLSSPDNDDNEDVDQNGYLDGAGVVITDPITLSFAATPPDPLTGDIVVTGEEPIGEDVAGVDFFSLDGLSNLTLDIGLLGQPDVELVKEVNNDDANIAPGVYVAPSSLVTWTYTVENLGQTDLFNVAVTDDQLPDADISCVDHLGDTNNDNVIDVLRVGESVVCTATGSAVAGQYTNTGTVDASPPVGDDLEDEDPANYYGYVGSVEIEKSTNGDDADTTSGPQVPVGGAITWTFEVTNTGNVDLAAVQVTDNIVAASSINCGAGTNVIPLLLQGAANSVTCTATGTATADQYENTGSVTGTPVDDTGTAIPGAPAATDEDDSHYFGTNTSIDLEKSTNAIDADTPTGPVVAVGDPITWTYVITNDGNTPLVGVTVTDNQLAFANIVCAPINDDPGGNNVVSLLLPTQSVTCTATGTATAGQYTNTGAVFGDPAFPTAEGDDYDPTDPSTWPDDLSDYTEITGAPLVTDSDPSHYLAWTGTPDIEIEKSTNGFDADNPAGPFIIENGGVSWTYEIENTGDMALTDVVVNDDQLAATDISCAVSHSDNNLDNSIDLLLPGEIVICTAMSTAQVVAPIGQYTNLADVTGDPAFPSDPGPDFDPTDGSTYPTDLSDFIDIDTPAPTDEDRSHYFSATPEDPAADIEKATNGFDADTPAGPYLIPGTDTVTWTFVVENTGGYVLAPATITDNMVGAGSITCADHLDDTNGDNVLDVFRPGDIVTCTATATASVTGLHNNIAMITGSPVVPENCVGCDPDDPTTWPSDPDAYVPAEDPAGDPLSDATEADPSHYFGAAADLELEKSTNLVDADTTTGPFIAEGAAVTWSYRVENTGNVPLAGVAVTDNVVAAADISCPTVLADTNADNVIDILLPGEVVTCTATGVATAGQYANVASTDGNPVYPTNPGPDFDPNDPATYPTDPGAYTDLDGVADPSGTDPSHYFGYDGDIDVEKATNGDDADAAPGPWVAAGDTVTWTYRVENTGNVALMAVPVADNVVAASAISCANHLTDTNADNVIDVLLPGDVVICTASAPNGSTGQYTNTASVEGTPAFPTAPGPDFDPEDPSTYPTGPGSYTDIPAATPPTDADDSNYYTATPSVTIEKDTLGDDADATSGPWVAQGDIVTWTFVVENNGNTALANVTVGDSQGVTVDCGAGSNAVALMLPGDTATCTASAPANTVGVYENIGDVSGDPVFPTDPTADPADPSTWSTDPADYEDIVDPATGDPIDDATDTDPSHYFGADSSIIIEKSTNGDDADTPAGPWVLQGDTVTWTYDIENDGNTALLGVAVTDSVVAATDISCDDHRSDTNVDNVIDVLLPGDTVTCTASAPASTVGQYMNTGSAEGQPSFPEPGPGVDPEDPSTWSDDPADYDDIVDPTTGDPVDPADDDDDSHYFGAAPAVVVEKATNGQDADTPTGPFVVQGDTVTWTYTVANSGNTALAGVTVTDNLVPASGIVCADHRNDTSGDNVIDVLFPNDIVVCTASAPASTIDQYTNTAAVTGDPVFPADPAADPTDPSTWSDDPSEFDDIVDPTTGSPIDDPTDTDPSHYFGGEPSLRIEKATNGDDADTPQGPWVVQGDTVTWTYTIVNDGNVPITGVAVTDSIVPAADISCVDHLLDTNADNVIDLMLPNDIVVCTASAPASTVGQYMNTGDASGQPAFPSNPGPDFDPSDPSTYPTDPSDFEDITDPETGDPVPPADDDDDSHFYGAAPALEIQKATNGDDADTPTGPFVVQGDTVTWTYVVENTGNTPLGPVTVSDDQLPAFAIVCDDHLFDASDDNVVNLMLPGDIVTCTATAPASTVDQYTNLGSASGAPVFPSDDDPDFDPEDPSTYSNDPADYEDIVDPETGDPVPPADADDPSHYFGSAPSLVVEKSTLGQNADEATGPYVPVGSTVTWQYVIVNDGNTALLGVEVLDDQIAATDITCADHLGDTNADNVIDMMIPGDIVICTASGPANTTGQYMNTGSGSGQPSFPSNPGPDFDPSDPSTYPTDPSEFEDIVDPETGDPVPTADDDDPSHYFGTDSSINIEKSTNGLDADVPTGPNIPVGSTSTWTYVITNDGNTPLTAVFVGDDQVAAADISCADHLGDTNADNVIDLLVPGDIVVCVASAPATAGQYTNEGNASGNPSFPTNPGPDFDPSDPSTYPSDPAEYEDIIDPDTGEALPPATDVDDSHFFGVSTGGVLDIEKSTQGEDADAPSGPFVIVGDTVVWTYTVTNNSNSAMSPVVVSDDQVSPADISCADYLSDVDGDNLIDVLLPGATVDCTATAPAGTLGQYANIGGATGQPVFPTDPGPDFDPTDPDTWPTDPGDYGPTIDPDTGEPTPPVSQEDPSHYWGATTGIDLEKLVNLVDEDEAPGAQLENGGPVSWSYVVTNTGSTPLTGIVVNDDDPAVTPDCGDGTNTISLLLPGEVATCTASGIVGAGAYENLGSATGQPSFPETDDPTFDPSDPTTWPTDPSSYPPIVDPETGDPIPSPTDDDPSHHFGNGGSIELQKEICLLDDTTDCDPAEDSDWGETRIHQPGDAEVWRLSVTNTGNVTLTDIVIDDPLAPECAVLLPDLAPGESYVHVCESNIDKAPLENVATVKGTGPSGREIGSTDTAGMMPPPELQITKTVDNAVLKPGGTAVFTVVVANVGEGVATNATVVDTLPLGMDYVSDLTTGLTSSIGSASNERVWALGTLNPDDEVTFQYETTIQTNASGELVNEVAVGAAETEPTGTLDDNEDKAQVTVSAPSRPGGPIAFTGGSALMTVVVALGFLTIGGALVLGARRRNAHR